MPPRKQTDAMFMGFDADGNPMNKEQWEYDANKRPVFHKTCENYLGPNEKTIMDHLAVCCKAPRSGISTPQFAQPQSALQPFDAVPPAPPSLSSAIHPAGNPYLDPLALAQAMNNPVAPPSDAGSAYQRSYVDLAALSDAGTEYQSVVSSRRSMTCRECGSEEHTAKSCPMLSSTREVVSNIEML